MECITCNSPLDTDEKRCKKCGTNVPEPITSKPVVKKVVEVKPTIKQEAKRIVDKLLKKKK